MNLDRSKIDVLLARRGIRRSDLAKMYGCTTNRISAILNCANVRPTTAAKLAKALDVDVTEILTDE
ncbi:MAG: helix-turn-helix transcriptional regulator [Clostridiales bacterium]|nr:helix-turn-helix transcriptional regulator [Clostridiales bacterium]